MSVEKKNSVLRYPIKCYDTNIKLKDNLINLSDWSTETHETFVQPKTNLPKIGKRKEILMKYFRMRASEDALEKIVGDTPLPESFRFTEYICNFCDNNFTPLVDNPDFYSQKLAKNYLHNENVKTYYKEQFDKKNLKVNTELRNEKRPFVKRTLFTTPPSIALEEPMDGF